MLFQAGALALGLAATSFAFQDTSPFMLFSTTRLDLPSQSITTASDLLPRLDALLSDCPTNVYVLVHQPGVSSADYQGNAGRKQAHLRAMMTQSSSEDDPTFIHKLQTRHSLADVQGELASDLLQRTLRNKCHALNASASDAQNGAAAQKNQMFRVDFDAPPTSADQRLEALRQNDQRLLQMTKALSTDSVTIVYTTSPRSAASVADAVEDFEPYSMDDDLSPLSHIELKRDLYTQPRPQASNDVPLPDGPLFERYAYITPGIFMGLLVLLFIFAIMYVAISAISSLQISYAAFDKEMAPAQQGKKAQ